jgi:rRNA maturation protein Nop10
MTRKIRAGLILITPLALVVLFTGGIEITHALAVPLTVTETAGIARFDAPITSGVPIPREEQLIDLSPLCLRDANGTAIPAQFTPQARWHRLRAQLSRRRWLCQSTPQLWWQPS